MTGTDFYCIVEREVFFLMLGMVRKCIILIVSNRYPIKSGPNLRKKPKPEIIEERDKI